MDDGNNNFIYEEHVNSLIQKKHGSTKKHVHLSGMFYENFINTIDDRRKAPHDGRSC